MTEHEPRTPQEIARRYAESVARYRRLPITGAPAPEQQVIKLVPVYHTLRHPRRHRDIRYRIRAIRIVMPYGVTYTTDAAFCANLGQSETGENEFEALLRMIKGDVSEDETIGDEMMPNQTCYAMIDGSTRLPLLWISRFPGDVVGNSEALAVPVKPFGHTPQHAGRLLERFEDDEEGLLVVIA